MILFLKIYKHYKHALRKNSKPRSCIIFFMFCLSISFAQNGTIKGTLKDIESVLPFATISVGNKTALTNNTGEFSISILPGTYTLTITHVGYKKIEQPITISAGETQLLQFKMVRDEQMGEEVVLGSRSVIHRSNLNTAVPVDVVYTNELSKTNFSDPKLMLSANVPSFNSPPQNVGPPSYLEPATLRGLAPDQLLVLVNGRRRHTMAATYSQNTIGRGTAGTDLNSIPRSAIDKIEVLRDGAAAQYGSDAIAGVINIELKKSTGKTSINLQTGQRYKGDGEQINFGINRGFKFLKKGFLNFSADMRHRNPTDRAGLYMGTVYFPIPKNATHDDSIRIIARDNDSILAKGFDRKKVAKVGTPDLLNTGIVVNGGYPLNQKTDLFWMGSINYRIVKNMFAGGLIYRFPKDSSRINFELFPDGFLAYGTPSLWDGSGIMGIEGKTNKGWHWDISNVYGSNAQRTEGHNTNNASQQFMLGKNAQTDFYTGTAIFRQNTNDINFARDFAKELSRVKSFNLAMGGEFRIENYQIREGEKASWDNYDTSRRKASGSQVFGGADTSNAVNATRHVSGFYTEVEVEKNDHFLFNIAGRYEYYSDFGGNLAGKLAMRYKFSDKFSLRGAISNGFRAPSMQQTWLSRTNQVTSRSSVPTITGTFRNNSDVVRAFDIPALGPEKSVNLSGGFTSQLSGHMSLTIDAYWIQIRDRIILTGSFDTTNPAVKQILINYPNIQAVIFFTNAINTRTRGIDIVWNGKWNIWKSKLEVGLSANFNRTHLFGKIETSDKLPNDSKTVNTVINPEVRGIIEWGQPHQRIIFRVEYTIGKVGFRWTNVYAGKTKHFNSGTDSLARTRDESFSPKINSAFTIHYTLKPWLTLALGARNLFDVYPDPVKNYFNTLEGTWKYDSVAPQFGFDGGYYFVSISFNF
jgi:iron complex outermembrane receptor protein